MDFKKMQGARRAGAVYCLTSVITKAITLITTPIFTRIMSSAEYGKYILYISLYGITAAAASVGASSGVIYNVFAEREDKMREISFSGFLASVPINAAICILLFAFSGILELDVSLIPFLFIHTALDVLTASYLLKSRYSYRASLILKVEVAKSVLDVAISYYLVAKMGLGALGRVLGFVLSLIPFAIISLVYYGRSPFHIPRPIMSRVSANSLPASFSALFLSLGVYLVNIVISVTLGKESLAIFSIFNTIATSPVFLITALVAAMAPSVQREAPSGDMKSIKDKYKNSSALIASVIMLVSLISREAISFLAPKSYDADIYILLPMLLYSYLKLADQFLGCVLNAKRIYRYSLISNAIFSISTLAILLILIDVLGLLAAGISLLIGAILSVAHKLTDISHSDLAVISVGDIILPFLGVFGFSATALALSDAPALRTLLAIFPAVRLLNLYFSNNGALAKKCES